MASTYSVEELSQEQVQDYRCQTLSRSYILLLKVDRTERHLIHFKNAFDRFDENGDGTITKAELNVIMHSLGHNPTDNELYEILTESGPEGYERIDFTEFLLMMAKRMRSGATEDELMAAFRAFDDDGDGFITSKELRQALIKVGEHMSEKEIIDMIKEADLDGDGMVNYQEFVQMVRSSGKK